MPRPTAQSVQRQNELLDNLRLHGPATAPDLEELIYGKRPTGEEYRRAAYALSTCVTRGLVDHDHHPRKKRYFLTAEYFKLHPAPPKLVALHQIPSYYNAPPAVQV